MKREKITRTESPGPRYPKRFSERVRDFDWRVHFPFTLGPGESVRRCELEELISFYASFQSVLFPKRSALERLFPEEFTEAKLRYYAEAGDCFAFVRGDFIYGVFVGTLGDWGSYYFRNCSILPEYQGGGRYQKLLIQLIAVLTSAGFDRIEADVSPSNLANIHILNKLKFNVTGVGLSDRWGALLHFTKFINPRAELTFLDRYCHGVWPQIQSKALGAGL